MSFDVVLFSEKNKNELLGLLLLIRHKPFDL
jgi:hypothetical protein